MIEFKQIVGRGTRLFEGKDYFTIYDFVKAYKHFNDPAWDGEPLEPEPKEPRGPLKECSVCGQKPCIWPKPDKEPCEMCGYIDCRCDNQKEIIEVVLSDGKVRQLQSMTTTTFWSPDGKPITATEFLKTLYGSIPDLFNSEEDLKTHL